MAEQAAASRSRRAVLILGMHRAGTSALARVLSFRGADLPRHVMPANEGNPSGYWEPQRIVALNDDILRYFGTAWDDPFASFQLPAPNGFPSRFRQQALDLLAEEFAGSDLFVLKDPRCTLLWGFWLSVLQEAGAEVAPVVIMRPPAEVAESLRRRDGMSPALASLLYVGHALECSAVAQSAPTTVLTYSQLLDDWRTATDRIASAHGFAWPVGGARAQARIEEFLKPASQVSRSPVLPEPLARWVDASWHWVSAGAEGAPAAMPAGIAVELETASQVFSPALAWRAQRIDALSTELEAAAAVESRLHGLYEESQAVLAHAVDDRDEAQRQVATLVAQRDELQADRDRALEQLGILEQEHRALADAHHAEEALRQKIATQAEALEAQRDEFQADRDRVLGLLDALDAAHVALAAELAAVQAQRDEFQADRDRVLGQLQAVEADRDRVLGQLQAVEADRDHLLEEHRKLCGIHEQARLQHQREIDEIHASTSWRLTAPLREARTASRRLLGSLQRGLPGRGQLRLPGPVPAQAPPAAPAPASATGEDRHARLRGYLHEEFGPDDAAATVARIDRYGLPVDGAECRDAAETACAPDDAVRRARKLAVKAANAGMGVGEPDVSIIVPVYNQVLFTLACIDALVAQRSRYRFEILVGDDGSTDATRDALGIAIPGLAHVAHASNLGFVRNCNATAARARGRYVVFLNNDTQVLPGWLDELVGTLEADPGIGLAGSKLVYPDGRLQECGAIVWRDGSAWNLGRFDDPRRPEYGYLRDCDYVSGASIALSKALWDRLGGFDERYVPAYAEDADLAFRIRDAGLRTVVQPLSQLLHFEGISSGTDTSRGVKAHQVANLQKLRDRWAHVLAGHRDNADRPDLEKERAVRKRVLFIDHCTPTPDEDAGSRVAWEVMSAFREEGYKVTFIPEDNFAHMGEDTRVLQRVGIEAIYHPAYSSMAAFLDARHDPFDVVFLHRYRVGEAHLQAVRKHFPGARVIFLNADMHFLREMREAEMSGDARAMEDALRTRSRELAVVGAADATLVHSETELDILAKECPGKAVTLFPLIHDPVDAPAPLASRSNVCFVGGFRHPPNADGIAWFVDEVWPRVLSARPDAILRIGGSHMTEQVLGLASRPNVEVVGFIRDLPGFLASHRLSVAPLRYGAGAKGKVAEALAHGLPVVGTPIAMEGMQLDPGKHVLVGASPDVLADAVVAVLDDDALWERLSSAGLAYAGAVTSRRHARQRMRAVLEQLRA